jgi:hypothetical protein
VSQSLLVKVQIFFRSIFNRTNAFLLHLLDIIIFTQEYNQVEKREYVLSKLGRSVGN